MVVIPAAAVIALTGAAALVLGIMILAWPGLTLGVIAVLFGIQLISMGALQLAAAASTPVMPVLRILIALLGVLVMAIGVVCLFDTFASLHMLAVFTAIGWLGDAVASFVRGAHGQGGLRWGSWIFGVVSLVGAVVLLSWPGLSLDVLARLAGWILVGVGISQLVVVATDSRR